MSTSVPQVFLHSKSKFSYLVFFLGGGGWMWNSLVFIIQLVLTPTVQPKLCKWFYSHHTLADRTTWWTALNVYDAIFLIIGVLLWFAVAGVLTNPPNGSTWNNPTYCPKYIATYQWLSKFLGLAPKSALSQLSTKNLGQAVAWCMNGSTIHPSRMQS